MGGFGRVTDIDVRDSNTFLDLIHLKRPDLCHDIVADCGAGIGRVTKYLLLPRYKHVDMIEQSARLLQSSTEYIGADSIRTTQVTIGLQVCIYDYYRAVMFVCSSVCTCGS